MNQRGAVPILPVVIAAALGVGLAASMYLNWAQYQRMQDEKRLLQGTISDLKYQVAQDAAAGLTPKPSASPSASPVASATPTPVASPTPGAVAGTQSLAIPELGVKLTTAAPIPDLTYSYQAMKVNGVSLAVANLRSPSFAAANPSCTSAASLGQLVRRPNKSSASRFIKTIGGYNYYYVTVGNCGNTAASKAAVNQAVSVLVNTILPTITQ